MANQFRNAVEISQVDQAVTLRIHQSLMKDSSGGRGIGRSSMRVVVGDLKMA